MLSSNLVKTLLAASAVAGVAVLAAPSPGEAASSSTCSAYARDVASDYAPSAYRGPIRGLIALPFDVTGALLTGRTRTDFQWKRAYDAAYANCMSGKRVAVVMEEEPGTAAFAVVRPRTGSAAWIEYCSDKYRSFDPETGTYVTYSGEVVPCR